MSQRPAIEEAILAALGDAVVLVGSDGEIQYQGPSVTDTFGYEPGALLGTNAGELLHEADREAIEPLLASVAPGEPVREEVRIRHADGDWRWASVTITVPDGDAVDGYVVEARDVTEQVHARWEREELLDRMGEGFISMDTAWRVTHLNEAAAQFLDVDREAALGADYESLHPDDDRVLAACREAMETGESRRLEAYSEALDAWFDVGAYPSATGLSVFFEDITERKRTELAMANNEKAMRELHDVAADKTLAFESKLLRLLDLGRERLDLELGFLTRIEDDVQRVVACQGDHELLVRGESCPLEQAYCQRTIEAEGLLATRDPEAEWVADVAYETFGLETYVGGKLIVEGELYGTLCFADTERRTTPFRSDEEAFVELLVEWMAYELERERREARLEAQNDRLEAFASMVSHDLRNPLTVAQGHLELAEAGEEAALAEVATSLDRMERLIDDMLWLAREGQDIAEREPVALADVVREAWSYVETGEATLAVECEDCTVSADRERLLQLVENLLRNAIDHTDGEVTVRVGTLEGGFYVEDDGPGLPEEHRETLFETGFTTDEEGTGYGLAIVERLAEAHGWTVTAGESEAGGARFEFATGEA